MSGAIEMKKIRLQTTVREDLVKWIDKQVLDLRFASRSHAIEYAVQQLVKKEKGLPQIIPDDTMLEKKRNKNSKM